MKRSLRRHDGGAFRSVTEQEGSGSKHRGGNMYAPFWQIMAQAPAHQNRAKARTPRPSLSLVVRDLGHRHGNRSPTVDFVDLAAAQVIQDEWLDLATRSLEPNIFADPAFALSAAQHHPETQRPMFAVIRDRHDRQLLGVWMIEGHAPPLSSGFVRVWKSLHAVLGAPTIDRDRAAEVVDAMLDAVAQRYGARKMLLVPQLPRSGPTYGLLVARAMASGRVWGGLSPHVRAVLRAGETPEDANSPHARKAAKELRRKARRLGEVGAATVRSARTPDEIRAATEHFLSLESRGWKGARKTALLSDPASAAFTRTMLRTLAKEGGCRIDSLEIGGTPVAMGIVLNAGGRAYYWKTAFDETFAAMSPGVQLTAELTRCQLAETKITVTDSCAIAGHSMIERMWTGRQEIVDVAIAVTPGIQAGAEHTLRRERLRRQAREWAKGVVHAARRRSVYRLPKAQVLTTSR